MTNKIDLSEYRGHDYGDDDAIICQCCEAECDPSELNKKGICDTCIDKAITQIGYKGIDNLKLNHAETLLVWNALNDKQERCGRYSDRYADIAKLKVKIENHLKKVMK